MVDEQFRVQFARAMRPIAPMLARRGIVPNHVTLATFCIAIPAAILIGLGFPVTGLALWIVSRIGDGLDGLLARETGTASAFGGYLDITLDMAAYAAMVVGFAALHPQHTLGWTAILAGYVVVITTTLALSDAAGHAGRRVSETDRTFQFTAGFAEAGETSVMYVLWVLFPSQIGWLVWVWAALLLLTAVQRSVLAWQTLR